MAIGIWLDINVIGVIDWEVSGAHGHELEQTESQTRCVDVKQDYHPMCRYPCSRKLVTQSGVIDFYSICSSVCSEKVVRQPNLTSAMTTQV